MKANPEEIVSILREEIQDYDTRVQSVRLSMIYVNNSAKNGEQDFELEVEIDATTSKLLLNQAVEWLQAEKAY